MDPQPANDTAGVIVRPPLLFLGALLVGLTLDALLGWSLAAPGAEPLLWTVGGVMIVTGVAVFAAALRNFARAATPVQGTKPSLVLVTTGIHGWSRNPIYLGMFLIYLGIGIAARSPSVLILTLLLAIIMRYGVVAREEAYLERRFGDAYRSYKFRVRRWL
ncbi:MAG TPA: isoprenylcysteine carboxylmethyltransferase family protein [Rhizomicrobium sp.]|nr:isoprenylcysteine carboxylmethyltransferase family protein [Rhizomicrobium sp.]